MGDAQDKIPVMTLRELAQDEKVTLHIRLPEGMHKLLKIRAAVEGHSVSNYLRLLVRRDLLQANYLRPG